MFIFPEVKGCAYAPDPLWRQQVMLSFYPAGWYLHLWPRGRCGAAFGWGSSSCPVGRTLACYSTPNASAAAAAANTASPACLAPVNHQTERRTEEDMKTKSLWCVRHILWSWGLFHKAGWLSQPDNLEPKGYARLMTLNDDFLHMQSVWALTLNTVKEIHIGLNYLLLTMATTWINLNCYWRHLALRNIGFNIRETCENRTLRLQ